MLKSILNFSATLTALLSDSATVAFIDSEGIDRLNANLAVGDWIYATVVSGNIYEVVKITSVVGATIVIERAKDYTIAREFPIGAKLAFILGVDAVQDIVDEIQLNGGKITGDGEIEVTRGVNGEYIVSAPKITLFSVSEDIKVIGEFPNYILR
jgi:hypothetical protein